MKAVYEKLVARADEGFVVKDIFGDACDCAWHCHSEVELVLTLESQGYRIVGDNIHSLQPGDLTLLGPNLPHAYQHSERLSVRRRPAHCVLLQFDQRMWSSMLELPAMGGVRRLLARAVRGVQVGDPARKQVSKMLVEMLQLSGPRRIGSFLTLLDVIAQSRSSKMIASRGFTASSNAHEQARIGRICQFIDENYHRPLRIGEAARFAHMSEGGLSRFFRSHLGRTFPEFLNDLRIGRACRLLIETEMNVTEIALACGYCNLSNFNRQFLRLKGHAPGEFRRKTQRPG